ncbi:hypothetical protein BaRGS_00037175 [Batillaria attramentaria]|uniref:Uncharacterized protein n=1 Tax=Batillaria attramentaria TaxID=370345 RepID=A0ABD0JAC6_9CAEN
MACTLCGSLALLLVVLLEISHGATRDEPKLPENVVGPQNQDGIVPSAEVGLSNAKESTTTGQPTDTSRAHPKVNFEPHLKLTKQDLVNCFFMDSDLHLYASGGHISWLADMPDPNITTRGAMTWYVQTPGWSKLEPYPDNMDSCVTVKAPSQHFIMTSLLAVEFKYFFGDSLTAVQDCESEVFWQNVYDWNFKKERLIQSHVMSLRFKSGENVLGAYGFKFIFSFHNQSALPQRLSDGKWNCSVPHWADFQQHFLCTLYPECAGAMSPPEFIQRSRVEAVNCMAKTLSGVLCELVEKLPSSKSHDDTIHIQLPTVKANASGVNLTLCSANHSTHSFLACDVHSDCWLDDYGDCTAPMTSFPPQFTCANPTERVRLPYSLVCDYRVDCNDRSAKFHFPTVHHETMKLKENTQLTLSFELQKENCTEDDLKNLEIRVTKTDISGSGGATHCTIRHSEGKCIETFDVSDDCKCSSPGKYAFSKNVDRSDSTVWVWSTSGRQAEKKEITFDVEYAANCFPETRQFVVDGRLQYRQGICQEHYLGVWLCSAADDVCRMDQRFNFGSIIRPPQLKLHEKDVHVTAGEMNEIRFDALSHTTEIIECYVGKVLEINDRLQQCQSASVTSTYVIVSEKTSHTTSPTVSSVITFDGEAGVRDGEEDSGAGKAVGITFAVLIIVVAGVSVGAFYYFKIQDVRTSLPVSISMRKPVLCPCLRRSRFPLDRLRSHAESCKTLQFLKIEITSPSCRRLPTKEKMGKGVLLAPALSQKNPRLAVSNAHHRPCLSF